MKQLWILVFLLCSLLVQLAAKKHEVKYTKKRKLLEEGDSKSEEGEDDDDPKVEVEDDIEDENLLKNNQDEEQEDELEEIASCNNELLYSFGILNSGFRNEKSSLCEDAVKESCCSAVSEEIIRNFWKNNNKIKIKEYIESYIYLFKSILNYYENFINKAKTVMNFPNASEECKASADHLISNFVPKDKMVDFILKLEKTYQHLGFVRKSFYCVLCTVDTQGFFDTDNQTIKFANKFCENLVESSIKELAERTALYLPIFDHMNVIINCDPNTPSVPVVYDVSMALVEQDDIAITKCYQVYVKDQDPRVYLSDCLDFCKGFSLTSATEIFEGSFGKLNFLVNKIKAEGMKKEGIVFTDIKDKDYDFGFVSSEFFESNLPNFDLGSYTSKFERNGIELFYISAKSRFFYGTGNEANSSVLLRSLHIILGLFLYLFK